MSLALKSSNQQAHKLLLYRNVLHPDLFPIKGRRTIRNGSFGLEAWVMPGAHLLRFEHQDGCLCELVVDREDNLPLDGAVTAFPCTGEHDFEHRFEAEKITYMTGVQTETLSETIYTATYREMLDLIRETEALAHHWTDGPSRPGTAAGKCVSILDVQRFNNEVHVQAYHLQSRNGFVLRTSTVFEHATTVRP